MNLLIAVPAYNAGRPLPELIRRIRDAMNGRPWRFTLLVVDDGSTDTTRIEAERAGVAVLVHPVNRGKGEALKSAFQYARDHAYDLIATVDADLQHDPAALPGMLEELLEGKWDLVIGSRTFDRSSMSFDRFLSNTITSALVSRCARQEIPDSQSGYRVMRVAMLRALNLRASRYELESELLIKAGRAGFRIGHCPVETIYAGEASHIRHLTDTLRFIRMFVRSLFGR